MLHIPGIPVSNWVDIPEYQEKTYKLISGDRFFLCTDGVIEIKNDNNEQYGEERLLKHLLNQNTSLSGTLNGIIEDIKNFTGASQLTFIQDDITMVLLEVE